MIEKFQVQFLYDAAGFLDHLDEKGSIENIQFGRNVGQTYRRTWDTKAGGL